MRHQLFRNKQRLYHALRRYCGGSKRKVFEIQGCVSTAPNVSHDEFLDAFIEFVESKGWYFGGGTKDMTEDALDPAEIEELLDEADKDAGSTDVRYTNEDVFGKD